MNRVIGDSIAARVIISLGNISQYVFCFAVEQVGGENATLSYPPLHLKKVIISSVTLTDACCS